MKRIEFCNVIPDVFSKRVGLKSDIWFNDATFDKGGLYLVEADSGKGKSTFCSYILGYRHDYSGRVMFDDRQAADLKVGEWVDVRKRHVACLFQELRLFPELTAFENVEIKNRLTGMKTREEILSWFEKLGIGDKIDARVGHMSFGQQQRVALMRALVQPFDFILADEPISHLDDTNATIMGELMLEEARSQGAGVIVTSIGRRINLDYDKVFKL